MSKLSEEDAKLFHKLMDALLFYANKKLDVIKNISSKEEFFKRDLKETIPLRKKVYKNPEVFDDFISENPENFSQEELDILSSWKKHKSGEFTLAKYTKDYALFFDGKEKRAYGVLGLVDSFEEMLEGYAPIYINIILLPFKGKITYEGIFAPYMVHLGGGIRKSLKLELDEAIKKHGVITSLDKPAEEKTASDEEMLRFYMGSREKINRHWDEINKLRIKSSELEAAYYQEWAKQSAKAMKKSLKRNGVKGYFAVLDEAVIASGAKSKDLEKNIKAIVPENKLKWVYKFKV